jgi:hypothetical protein
MFLTSPYIDQAITQVTPKRYTRLVVSQFEISALGGERISGYWSHRQCDTQIVSNVTVRRRLKLF